MVIDNPQISRPEQSENTSRGNYKLLIDVDSNIIIGKNTVA